MSDRKLLWAVKFGSGFEVSLKTYMGPIESLTDPANASPDSLLGCELLLAAEPAMRSIGSTSMGMGSLGIASMGATPKTAT